jgi:formate hydrogenlyase transcriptional activator
MNEKVDTNEFFREVTLRLCSHLKIEEGLRECVKYIREFMPADAIYLQRSEKELNAFRVVARSTPDKCEAVNILAPLSDEAQAAVIAVKEAYLGKTLPTVIVVNNPEEEPITQTVQKHLRVPPSSVLSMPLAVEGNVPGALALIAAGNGRYTEKDAQLFAQLKEPFFVAFSNTLKHQRILELMELLEDDSRYFQAELDQQRGENIIGADFGLKGVMDSARNVAGMDSSVLITGETGTGKEIVANAIHSLSPRRDGAFIKVNCGAIPDALIDSELFGHEKGAYTGADTRRRGRFERAHGGTILLDEIGELPLSAQVRLLHVLQEKTIERVGGTDRIDVNIRVIAATHRDLQRMVREGAFREDLYFRLKVFPITIPPLRDRKGDIPALVQHVILKKAKEMKRGSIPVLGPGAIDQITVYDWPGNVRELENVIERAMITTRNDELYFPGLIESMDASDSRTDLHTVSISLPVAEQFDSMRLDDIVSSHIARVLKQTSGRIEGRGGASELLGLNPATLRNRMRKLGVSFGRKTLL